MNSSLATVAYIGATILFILSLGGLSNQETARRGNLYGMIGMSLAVLATIFGPQVTAEGIPMIVGAMLVGDTKHHLLGIFTGRDALRCLAEHENPGAMPLRAVMSANPCTMDTSGSAMDALRLLNDAGIRHLPIVDHGKLMGIVSRYDFRQMEHRRLDEESGFFESLR
jgi:CBS domain-containing protein